MSIMIYVQCVQGTPQCPKCGEIMQPTELWQECTLELSSTFNLELTCQACEDDPQQHRNLSPEKVRRFWVDGLVLGGGE